MSRNQIHSIDRIPHVLHILNGCTIEHVNGSINYCIVCTYTVGTYSPGKLSVV